MNYTINGKEYIEFDINKRCAEIEILNLDMDEAMDRIVASQMRRSPPDYCKSVVHTWPIIERCWGELMFPHHYGLTKWEFLIKQHNCSRLVAACICFIETSGHTTNDD